MKPFTTKSFHFGKEDFQGIRPAEMLGVNAVHHFGNEHWINGGHQHYCADRFHNRNDPVVQLFRSPNENRSRGRRPAGQL